MSYSIQYCPGPENVAADTLSRSTCFTLSSKYNLEEIHTGLCHAGAARLLQYVRSKKLPFSTDELRKVCKTCRVCAEIKPQFYKKRDDVLIKATKPMERLSIYFKVPFKSSTRNKYFVVAINVCSRFPFAFPCSDMEPSTIIKFSDSLFVLCGTAGYVLSDWSPSLVSEEQHTYLLSRRIASSHSAPYNPRGNSQVERFVQTVWKSTLLLLKTHKLPTSEWEQVMPESLHLIQSLTNTTNNETPH